MELMYTNSISKDVAEMYIYSEIGYSVNGQSFVNELNYITDTLQVPVVNVRINSPGGSVLDGMGIFAAILNSKATVNTYIDGIAASAAGFIAMAGKKRYMASHAQIMMHNVGGGYADNPEQQAKIDRAKDSLEDSIATILSNNSGLTKDEVREKMNRETWMGANEALELKFIDAIYDSTPKKRMPKNELMNFVNSIVKPNNKKMNKVSKYLNLSEDASEDSIVTEIEKVKNEAAKVADLEKENADLKTKLEALEAEKAEKEAAEKEALAVAEVTNQIEAGKFDESKKDELIEFAKKDIEGFKNLAASIVVAKAPDLSNQINKGKGKNEKHGGKTYRELEKTKEGLEYLANLASTDPEEERKFYNESYNIYK